MLFWILVQPIPLWLHHRPAMARQRDRHHARPRDRPTRGNRGPHHPAQGPQGRPPAGGHAPSPLPPKSPQGERATTWDWPCSA